MVGGRGPVARMTCKSVEQLEGGWTVGGVVCNGVYERGELTWMRIIAECIQEVDEIWGCEELPSCAVAGSGLSHNESLRRCSLSREIGVELQAWKTSRDCIWVPAIQTCM